MSLQDMERLVERLIEQEETELAAKHIYELIVSCAKAKDFTRAYAWRDKLIEIDPMALAEIVDSAEVIEAEKADAIDDDHKVIWQVFYDSLSQEQANSFYLKLSQRDFPPGKVIIQQGKLNNTLFFIDQGRLKIIFSHGGKEVFLKELDRGCIAGQDTFFPISSCTTTVVSVTPVKIRFLDREALGELEKESPGFAKKLENYCSSLDEKDTETILKKKALERRRLKRYKLTGKITSQIIDREANPVGPAFYGGLEDISTGGASFSIQCSNKDVGRTLLGRMTSLTIRFEKGPQVEVNGLILGAKFDLFNTYTIHLRFTKPFSDSKLRHLVAIVPPSSSSPSRKK